MKLQALLQAGKKHNASDIHIVVGLPPTFRIDGEILTAKGDAVTAEKARALAVECLNDEQIKRLESEWQLCFSTAFGDRDRARPQSDFRDHRSNLE